MEKFERKGVWWLPQFPERRAAGSLSFHPIKGATLKLIGDNFFQEIADIFQLPFKTIAGGQFFTPSENIEVDTILGYADDNGDPITLYRCIPDGGRTGVPYPSQEFSIEVVFLGGHFEKGDELIFDKLMIEYSHLTKWLGIAGFSHREQTDPERIFIAEYKFPSKPEAQVNDAKVTFDYRLSQHFEQDDYRAHQTTWMVIIPNQPTQYREYQSKYIHPLRNFLSLALNTTVLPFSVIAHNKDHLMFESESSKYPQDIEILYAAQGANVNREGRSIYSNLLFKFSHVADNFEGYLQQWFLISETLRPVMDLYFGQFYIPSMYVHLEFLSLAQALETFHRRQYDGQYMSKDKYEPVYKLLVDNIPSYVEADHRQRLEGAIKHGYEFSFRTRLKRILNDVLAPYSSLVSVLASDQNSFVDKIVSTRNYLTHYDKDSEKNAFTDPNQQHILAQKMKLLVQLCFFKEIDFPKEVVEKIMSQNSNWAFWTRQ